MSTEEGGGVNYPSPVQKEKFNRKKYLLGGMKTKRLTELRVGNGPTHARVNSQRTKGERGVRGELGSMGRTQRPNGRGNEHAGGADAVTAPVKPNFF